MGIKARKELEDILNEVLLSKEFLLIGQRGLLSRSIRENKRECKNCRGSTV